MDVLDWDSTRVFELDGHEDHFTSSKRKRKHHISFPHAFSFHFFSSCAFFNDHQFFLLFCFFCEQKSQNFGLGSVTTV